MIGLWRAFCRRRIAKLDKLCLSYLRKKDYVSYAQGQRQPCSLGKVGKAMMNKEDIIFEIAWAITNPDYIVVQKGEWWVVEPNAMNAPKLAHVPVSLMEKHYHFRSKKEALERWSFLIAEQAYEKLKGKFP